MRLKITAFVFVLAALGALPLNAQLLPVGANGAWRTDIFFLNRSNVPVTQKVGHIRFVRPGTFNEIIIEPTITLAAGETRWLRRVDLNFDRDYRQIPGCYDSINLAGQTVACAPDPLSSSPGMYVLQVDPRLDATAVLEYPGVTVLEINAVTKLVSTATDVYTYRKIGTSTETVVDGVALPARGAFPTFFNLGGPLTVTLRVFDATMGSYDDQTVTVFPGISQPGIFKSLPAGGTVRMYLGIPGAGGSTSLSAPFGMVIAQGPRDGKQQSIRYPE